MAVSQSYVLQCCRRGLVLPLVLVCMSVSLTSTVVLAGLTEDIRGAFLQRTTAFVPDRDDATDSDGVVSALMNVEYEYGNDNDPHPPATVDVPYKLCGDPSQHTLHINSIKASTTSPKWNDWLTVSIDVTLTHEILHAKPKVSVVLGGILPVPLPLKKIPQDICSPQLKHNPCPLMPTEHFTAEKSFYIKSPVELTGAATIRAEATDQDGNEVICLDATVHLTK
eukprot:GFYU01010226.1.p1 GENE.GFYU01010226.1~~GFYU01010226.1.p1  ORF type:complete len:224 (+),score=61.91 GFYU01010226.1:126-797(+)